MADALVSVMLKKLATVIQDEIQQEVSLVVGSEEELKKLTTTFKVIQAVLNDAEHRQIKDEAVKVWLEEIKDIAYDMDDVLDEWSFEILKVQTDTGVGNKKKKVSSYLRSLCSCFSKVALRHSIGTKIKDIRERLDLAEREKHKYHLVEMKSNENPIERFKSSSLINVLDIYGRLEDKEIIMSKLMLLGESSSNINTNQQETSNPQALHAPKIISIVGMGGLGKTTLAQLVFNDDQVKTHFKKIMWVCVSDPFDLVTVTKAIIEEAKCQVPNSSEWQTLHHCLSESVRKKLFLLVLDDVWTDNQSNWEPLKLSLSYGAQGSRVLVTTRNERVALMMNASYTHYLGNLSNDDCYSLLSHIAFAGMNKENQEELKEIGKKISKKCKGLPLAAKTLGGLLHFKKNKKEWLHILESEIWKLEEVENGFLKPALLLSYYDLPLPLKGCFVYCSIFPKDYKFKKDFLIKLWMAQGFIKSTSANEELEMIGEDYFNNLAMRSFFQDLSKDNDGNISCCKMHDLVHDLAQFLTKNECAFTQYSDTQILNPSNRVRHLTLVCEEETMNIKDSYNYLISSIHNAKKLRTLQIYNLQIQEAPADLFNHLRCLKVLCLNHIGLENLSSEIVNLIHLRYLDLSNNKKLKILPETISSLYNLQTLKLKGCECLCKLPREMWRMINLRHLDIRKTDELSHIPRGIGRLSSLKTLSDFIVGGTSEGCKIGELKELNLLQGRLSIRGLGRVETVNEAFEMGLKKKHLHSLTLGFKTNEKTENGLEENLENLQRMEDVLEVLEPHPDLVELKITHYLGFRLSSWIENTVFLCHIRTLKLYDCINLTKLPTFGQLPSLEVLDIKRAIKVKQIGFEFYTNTVEHVNTVAFPKLKELYMVGMNDLEVWELEHGVVMPYLTCIRLMGCPKLKALPALGKLPSLEELCVYEADELMHVGCEFLYENDEAGGKRFNNIAFPKLKYLQMSTKKLEWDFIVMTGIREEIIMPSLRRVDFGGCKNLKPLVEVLSKMPLLETLEITGEATEFITYIGHQDDVNDGLHVTREILFPNLNELILCRMDMEELKLGFEVMPALTSLRIHNCEKLKAIQGLSKLEALHLKDCLSLYALPLPNLKTLVLTGVTHPSLPQAFGTTLQALERLHMFGGFNLTCMPEEVQQLTSLRILSISSCSELEHRCRKDGGEDWRIISHIPNIYLNFKKVK